MAVGDVNVESAVRQKIVAVEEDALRRAAFDVAHVQARTVGYGRACSHGDGVVAGASPVDELR